MSAATDWAPVRIVDVVDTRAVVEDGDRWVRIPGSGDARPCDRCGRMHEVHATVVGDDGAEHRVGVGCAHATGPVASQLRSVVSATATAGKLRAMLEAARARDAHIAAVRADVATMAPPDVVSEPDTCLGDIGWRWHLGDGTCRAYGRSQAWYAGLADYYRNPEAAWREHDAERRGCVVRQWRDQQLTARGVDPHEQPTAADVARRLAKAERRLRALLT